MLRLYNSLTRTVEDFTPLNPPHVGMYTCGPTVYSFATIGNFRTYTAADFLIRTLQFNGYDVQHIMNLTDVGHLTGDNEGDADTGEDRMEKSAKREGKTAWEVAEFYTDVFLTDFAKLRLTQPQLFARATDHIKEQIALVQTLEEKGYTYTTSDGVYFDTSKFPHYGELSNLDEIKEGARVEVNPEKKNPRDFALWKFSPSAGSGQAPSAGSGQAPSAGLGEKRQMEWDSPWGTGFPGWHIECSAMGMKYLGNTLDIHAGGIDLRETHHPNEIAQSEAATRKKFVNYWMHGAFMLVNGEKMSKSKGNVYRLYDLEKEGYEPLALRYLYMQTHYRQEMNFTLPALDAAQNALQHLRREIAKWDAPEGRSEKYETMFKEALNDDLNMPEALRVVWDMIKSPEKESAKLASIFAMDEVLGLDLQAYHQEARKKATEAIPQEVRMLVKEREELRRTRQYGLADQLRGKIKKLGYDIKDNGDTTEVIKL